MVSFNEINLKEPSLRQRSFVQNVSFSSDNFRQFRDTFGFLHIVRFNPAEAALCFYIHYEKETMPVIETFL